MKLGSDIFQRWFQLVLKMGRKPKISPTMGSAEEQEDYLQKQGMKAWDCSVNTAHEGMDGVRKLSGRLW
jgi:hypothetical protein